MLLRKAFSVILISSLLVSCQDEIIVQEQTTTGNIQDDNQEENLEIEEPVLLPTVRTFELTDQGCAEGSYNFISFNEYATDLAFKRTEGNHYELILEDTFDTYKIPFQFADGRLISAGNIVGDYTEDLELRAYLFLTSLKDIQVDLTESEWKVKLVTEEALQCTYDFSARPKIENDRDDDGVVDSEDCAPNNPHISNEVFALHDLDGDGYAGSVPVLACAIPVHQSGDDCNDENIDVNPGAIEILDGIDNNCNDQVDEGAAVGVQDNDNDGIWAHLDCDDNDASASYEGRFFLDEDEDGFGNDSQFVDLVCGDSFSQGYIEEGGDCDDGNSDINPGMTEILGDGIDNDCDGFSESAGNNSDDQDNDGVQAAFDCDDNDASATFEGQFFPDRDGDGYGDAGDARSFVCGDTIPEVFIRNGDDCDDSSEDVYPGAIEIFGDSLDNDCDGFVDNTEEIQFS